MSTQSLPDAASKLVDDDKGLLAMDECNPTCNKRFAKLDIAQTVEVRRAYRELIVTTPGLSECISGAILYDETIRQQKNDGTPFLNVLIDAGIIPSIKVDAIAKDLAAHPGEKITEGLDGLRDRLGLGSVGGGYSLMWFLVNDRVKLLAYRTFDPIKMKTPSDIAPQIAKRAYELYEERGHQNGKATQDWRQAERETCEDALPK